MEKSSLEKVLQVKCSLHLNNPSDVLHVAPDAASHRACFKCVLSGDVPNVAALYLRSLFQMADHEDIIVSNYPPLGDAKIYKRLESIQQYSVGKTIEQIEQYISDLKRSFDEILDKIKKDSIKLVEEIGEQRRQVIELYKSLCKSNNLKEAVINASETNQEGRLHDIIVKKCQDSPINTSKLQSVISQFEANQQKLSIQLANESAESLLNIMRNISFFTSPISPLHYSHSILQEFQIVPSNHFHCASRTVISRKENNKLDALCTQNNGNKCIFYSSNVLDNNSHYSFRLAFHQESTKGRPLFNIGLINQQDQNKTTDRNLFRYREHSQECSINKIIKGKALNSTSDAKKVHKEVEMRIHLASQTVKVADFPNYTNVVELADKTRIKEGCQYLLFVELGGFINNYITVADVIISECFDDSM